MYVHAIETIINSHLDLDNIVYKMSYSANL